MAASLSFLPRRFSPLLRCSFASLCPRGLHAAALSGSPPSALFLSVPRGILGDDLAGGRPPVLPWGEGERAGVEQGEALEEVGEGEGGCGRRGVGDSCPDAGGAGVLEAMNRNAREGTKANHGKRPCSNRRRRRAARKRLSDHPFLPLKSKQPKGCDS